MKNIFTTMRVQHLNASFVVTWLALVCFLTGTVQAQTTQTFNYTGAEQTFVVPAGVTSLTVTAKGAKGGDGNDVSNPNSPGGKGGMVSATLTVTPSTTLYIYVGGQGKSGQFAASNAGATGAFNGGGTIFGYTFNGTGNGGGGGGTDIRIGGNALSNRVVVAGGGGGGVINTDQRAGGAGGGLIGGAGQGGTAAEGQGGTQSAGGAGGAGGLGGQNGNSGSLGIGGSGAIGGGGGGGGGYYGGGGGSTSFLGSNSGGGGGSSYTDATLCTNVVHTQGDNNGDGVLTITYTVAVACTNPTAYNVTGGGAYCAGGSGVAIGLSNSETGVTYQLKKGTDNVGMPVAGTGAAISFGNQTEAGTYTVVATRTTGGCSASMREGVTVTVNALPTVSITGLNVAYCKDNASVTLTGTPTGGSFTIDNLAAASFDPATLTVGPHLVVYTYTDANTCTNTATKSVLVNALPMPFTVSGGGAYCAGGTVSISLSGSQTGTSYQLKKDGSAVGDPKPGTGSSLTFGPQAFAAGTYTIEASIPFAESNSITPNSPIARVGTAPSCTATMTGSVTVTVNVTSGSGYFLYNNNPYCSNGGTATVTNTAPAGGTFSAPAGLSINASTGAVNLAASTPGTYLVTYSFSSACTSGTTTANITITPAPTATIAYSGTPYCTNGGTAIVTRTGSTGGTFSSTTGLSINATSGAITLATSTPGTYVVTLTIPAANGCAEFKTTANVTITTAPSATIAYSSSPYCTNGGTATVTRTGNAGGVYSSTTGLSIAAATGTITLASSTPGSYVVTYTIAAVNGCAEFKTTANVMITTAPSATIVYSNSPYCTNGGTATVTRTGNAGGVYSSTAGLTLDAATGTITLASSTPGTYLVTYTIAAANGCAEFKTTANVTITTAPSATIVYSGTPYCTNGGTATVTRTGNAGGVYSSTAGLTLDAATGTITLGSSTPGTYMVTYTIAAANGCAEFKTTANVTITTAPSATIAYSNSPYCTNGGTATVTRTGNAGGVYSSTTGLTLDVATGTITLASSTPGSYVVTYTIAAVNGCAEFKTTANVTITTAPSATIAYSSSPYCTNGGTATVTRTGNAGGVYSSTAGLTLDAATGTITLASNTPGSYVVTYTIAAANGCAEFKTTANVTITTAPSATIAYSKSPYCTNGGTATVTRTGNAGGVYSSTTGLSIAAATGTITLGSSTPGTYMVTYTIAAANGCAEFKTTANVTITTAPSATIAYSNSPYCTNGGTATVTRTGSTGGVYSSTAGLTLDAATGTITLASSTPDSYVVTYTIAAANGCAELKTTANVTITIAPSATIAYSSSPYCTNGGTATVTQTGNAGGVYSSTAGLTLDAATGTITLASSTPGGYVVTYTITAANGCAEFKTTANVTITTAPTATIAYSSSPYCTNGGTATVTQTGNAGGVYSSTAGLTLDAATGTITLASSTPDSYVVTYTIAAANGCAEFKTTANVTITTAPSATIVYSNSPYCTNGGTATVTQTGNAGGTYSSTAGLTLDASTGAITLVSSTPGTYLVTYTIAAANGCAEFKTTANVTITTAPTATIAYSGSPYCTNGGTATVTRTGNAGGVYSSTVGLTLDAATGTITLASSTPGSYVVTYTIAAANGCAEFKTTANITITTAPSATIAYSNSPYCTNGGTATVTRTGNTGGVYSSTAGLTLDAATGTITLVSSTPGSYVVTYTIAAANGCAEFKTTANVTIQGVLAAPTISSNQSTEVCANTEVLLYTNCPQGATVLWSNNSTTTILALNSSTPSTQTITVKCQQAGFCEGPSSAPYTVKWNSTFSLTFINIGQSQSGSKPEGSPKSAWSGQFITADAGPALEMSTQPNPTIYHSENLNKTAPRYWTIHAEACNLGTAGSLTFDMLATPEVGTPNSYNTHENNSPYLMYANRNGFSELYAQNHPAYGFFLDNGSGGNVYDAGLPKGLYKLGVRYWDQKGWGSIFPSTRKPQGNVLAYQEFWFRIQSKDGVGTGAARVASSKLAVPSSELAEGKGQWTIVAPNPVSKTMRLQVLDSKGQKVNVSMLDASGRTMLQRSFAPDTNAHQEEFEVSEVANGMYFLHVNTEKKQATLKVVKVE